jgi:large subunit ribosomal protein L9
MEVILLEKIRNFGSIGEKVSVKAGFARNYLIPHSKAVMATATNLEKFAKMRDELEKNAALALASAQERATKLADTVVIIPSKATEEGKLFGSISAGIIANALKKIGIDVKKSEISMPQGPLRNVGEHEIVLLLHTDVTTKIKVNVTIDKE